VDQQSQPAFSQPFSSAGMEFFARAHGTEELRSWNSALPIPRRRAAQRLRFPERRRSCCASVTRGKSAAPGFRAKRARPAADCPAGIRDLESRSASAKVRVIHVAADFSLAQAGQHVVALSLSDADAILVVDVRRSCCVTARSAVEQPVFFEHHFVSAGVALAGRRPDVGLPRLTRKRPLPRRRAAVEADFRHDRLPGFAVDSQRASASQHESSVVIRPPVAAPPRFLVGKKLKQPQGPRPGAAILIIGADGWQAS